MANGKLKLTIEVASQEPGKIGFKVTRSEPYNKEVIWVTNRCFDFNGNEVTKVDGPVLWGTTESLEGTAEFSTSGVKGEAYVTLRPWTGKPYSKDAVVEYTL